MEIENPPSAIRDPQSPTANPWYEDGVRFSCQSGCTRCCGGAPGDVFVTREDIQAMAAHLRIEVGEFEASYVRHYSSGRMTLAERRNGDCVMLDGQAKGCGVYAVRPQQCRDYPFWPEIMESSFAWLREAARCPGIGAGDLHAAVRITDLLKGQE